MNKTIYHCCSYNLRDFLETHNIWYVNKTKKWNKEKARLMDCFDYVITNELEKYLIEWSKRKQDNDFYYKVGDKDG